MLAQYENLHTKVLNAPPKTTRADSGYGSPARAAVRERLARLEQETPPAAQINAQAGAAGRGGAVIMTFEIVSGPDGISDAVDSSLDYVINAHE